MRDLFSQRLLVTVMSVLGATLVFLLLRDRSDKEATPRLPCTIWSVSTFLIVSEIIDEGIAPFVQPTSWFMRESYGLGWAIMTVYPLGPVMLFLYLTNSKLEHVGIDAQCLSSRNILRGVKWGSWAVCLLMILGCLDPESARTGFEKYRDIPKNRINYAISDMTVEFLKVVLMLTVVSLAEEMIYRGLLYKTLRKRMAPWLAAILSALCFMVPHGGANVTIFAFACGNAMLLEKYGSLGPAVLVHAIWNVGSFTAGWLLITLQINARTVFGIGFLVTFLVWCWAWATLRMSTMKRESLPDRAGT